MKFLDKIDYPTFIIVAVLMLLVPFYHLPHSAEKIIMLFEGTLSRPLDIFDLIMHTTPTILLGVKIIREIKNRKNS